MIKKRESGTPAEGHTFVDYAGASKATGRGRAIHGWGLSGDSQEITARTALSPPPPPKKKKGLRKGQRQ